MSALLEVSDLTAGYGQGTVLHGVSFHEIGRASCRERV